MTISNAYEDARMAGAYSRLEFAGTYYLAYRDLPAIFRDHVVGTRAIDPFADAKPRLSRRGREARLRVNPEQAPAFMPGSRGVDFGCGSGRSTRFLTRLGFRATGVDIPGK